MATTAQQRNEELRAIISDAVLPLVERVGKLETKIDGLDKHYQPRELADARHDSIMSEISALRDELKQQKDALFRWLGVAASAITIIVLFAQHIHIS